MISSIFESADNEIEIPNHPFEDNNLSAKELTLSSQFPCLEFPSLA